MKTPRVSIGLPVRNGEEYLRVALDSLLAQDYPNFELIISDNASSDATPKICSDYARVDSRIRVYRSDTNVGAAENFNRVFRASHGEYFMWAAHDDRWHPSYISRCVARLDREPKVVLCASAIQFMDRSGGALSDTATRQIDGGYNRLSTYSMSLVERVKELTTSTNWYVIYGLIRASVLRETGLFREEYGSDVLLLMELLFRGETLVLPETLFYYRLVQKSVQMHYEDLTGAASNNVKLSSYTTLANSLLRLIEESSFPVGTKSVLREDLLENVSFANQTWAKQILSEHRTILQPDNRYLASVQIRDLLTGVGTSSPKDLQERAYLKRLSSSSRPHRIRLRAERVLDRHFSWRFRSK